MKTFRYMLIAVAMLSAMSVSAHTFDKQWGQKPVIEMRSTSAMAYSGSTLPQAAATGVTLATVADVESSTSTRPYHPGRIRRASDEEEGDTPPVNPHGPNEDPLGDVLWPLMLMALAYVVYLTSRKKKENI
ncbi:MAG: hypothetical protein IJQ18_03270 [Paludibacteraceae bacterium]|nr:hypothetical protein [Paludibacteraceae bacterium]